ncbi:MAG: hypothetical protein ACRYGP_31845 [Janthinobacterium lividum]
MADNGNRGPNDFRARNVRKRREPPIIDASATEVPPAADEAAAPAGHPDAETFAATGVADHETVERAEPANAEPVLFGGPWRETSAKPESETRPSLESVSDGDSMGEPLVEPEPAPAAPIGADSAADSPVMPPSAAPTGTANSTVPPYAEPPTARGAGGGAAPWLLGICSLALAAALAWVLYTEPQRSGRDEIDELRTKVASLEARPDSAQIQSSIVALDKRLSAADADRAALAQTVGGLTTRVDSAKPAAEPAPSGEAAAATVGALGALAAKLDGLDGRLGALTTAQDRTDKAIADLPKPVAPDFGPVNARMADLDGRLTTLDTKVNAGETRLNGFDAKVNAVDSKINGFDARMNAFENRTNGIDARASETAAGLGTLQATIANLPRVDLAPVQAATTALDGKVAKIEGQLAAPKDGQRMTEARAVGSADETRATPIALVGQAVVRAVADGRPYASDLETLKALGADPAAVVKLAPLAAQGAPTVGALRQRWQDIEGGVLATVKPAEGGNALDRLAASARGLVQVRRVGAVQGDDPSALVSQIDAALAAGDVPGALAAWTKLPTAGQDKSRDWADAARSRGDADGAARDLVSRAIATLGKSKS